MCCRRCSAGTDLDGVGLGLLRPFDEGVDRKFGAVEKVAVPAGRRVERVVEAAFHLLDETEVVLHLGRLRKIHVVFVDRVDEKLAEVGLEKDAFAHHLGPF